jgi:hypothetical protein
MNHIFIIFLIVILIIGILYYYFTKEAFIDNATCLGSELDFNTDNKYVANTNVFSKVYNNNKIFKDSGEYLTFMNKDFTELTHQTAIASFLGLREAINLRATNDYQHYVIKHKMTVSFKSPVDKYLEITFNNFDNMPFVKIIYNHTDKNDKKCIIEKPFGLSTKVIDLPNGFGNKIEFLTITLRRNGVISNQFSIIINNTMYCSNLIGWDNHFYTYLRNITIYAPNTNVNNTFRISHMCSGEIYASYAERKIKSMRAERDNYIAKAYIHNFDNKGSFELLKPNTTTDYTTHYALGSYLNVPDTVWGNMRKNEVLMKPLILQDGDYVKPATSYTNVWGTKNPRVTSSHYLFLNPDDKEININGTNHQFKGLGGDIFEVTPGSEDKNIKNFRDQIVGVGNNPDEVKADKEAKQAAYRREDVPSWYYNQAKLEDGELRWYNYMHPTYPELDEIYKFAPLALVREDCLETHPNEARLLWNDIGSDESKNLSIWTYNHEYNGHAGHSGHNLVVFQGNYDNPSPRQKYRIKESCLLDQPQLLNDDQISYINSLVDQKIQNYLTKIVNLKREKDEKDAKNAKIASDKSQMNQITPLKTDINTMINDSKSSYDLVYKQNMDVNAMQNQYNKHYDFINLLKDKVTPVKNNEKILYNDYSPTINQITTEMNNKILSEPIGLFSEIDTNFITKSQQISDLTQQYNLQRESDKVLKFMGELISK